MIRSTRPPTKNVGPASLGTGLPADIILLISSHLPFEDLVRFSRVSRFCRSLLLHPILTRIRHLFVAENTFHYLQEPYGWRAKLGNGKSVAVFEGVNTLPRLKLSGPTTNIVYARLVAGVLLVSAYQPGRMEWNVRALFGDGAPPAEEEGGKGKGGLFAMKFLYDYLRVWRIRKGMWLDELRGKTSEFERREKEMMEVLMEVTKDGEVGDVLDMALDEDLLEWILFAGNRSAMKVLIEMGEVDSRNMTERYDKDMPCLMDHAIWKAMEPVDPPNRSHNPRSARMRFAELLAKSFPDALETCIEGKPSGPLGLVSMEPVPNPYSKEALLARRFKQSISRQNRQELTPFPEKFRNIPELTLEVASHLDLLTLQDFVKTSKFWRSRLTPLLLQRWGHESEQHATRMLSLTGSSRFRPWLCYLLWFLVETGYEEGMMKRNVQHAFSGREHNALVILTEISHLLVCNKDDQGLLELEREYLRLLADHEEIQGRTEELMRELVIISSEGPVDYLAESLARGLMTIGLFPEQTSPRFNKSYFKVLADCGKFKDEWLTTELVEPDGQTRRWFHYVLRKNMPSVNMEQDESVNLNGDFLDEWRRTDRNGLEFIEALLKLCPAALHSAFEYQLENGETIMLDAPALICRICSIYTTNAVNLEIRANHGRDEIPGVKIGQHAKEILELFHANGANFDLAMQFSLTWPSINNTTIHFTSLEVRRQRWWKLGIVETLLELGANPNSIRSRLSPESPRVLTTPLHPEYFCLESSIDEFYYFNLFLDHGYDGIDIMNYYGDTPLLHMVKLVLLLGFRERGVRQMLMLNSSIKKLLEKGPEIVCLKQWSEVVELVKNADEKFYSSYQLTSVVELKKVVASLEDDRLFKAGAMDDFIMWD